MTYDPAKPYNRPLPQSQTSSGSELDDICGTGIGESEAGKGLDHAIRTIDAKQNKGKNDE